MLKSEAWMATTTQARAVLIELHLRFNGFNNGRIALSVRDAAEACRISKNTVTRALRELQEKGFVRLMTAGSFNLKVPHAAEWCLTEHPNSAAGERLSTMDFMKWRAPKKENAVPIDNQRVPSIGIDIAS